MKRKKIIILTSIFLVLAFAIIYFKFYSGNNRKLIKEDVNHDGQIDIVDITMVARSLGSKPGDQNWNPDADINNDGRVDDLDMYMVEQLFKKVAG